VGALTTAGPGPSGGPRFFFVDVFCCAQVVSLAFFRSKKKMYKISLFF
jgi:hypothetical protein